MEAPLNETVEDLYDFDQHVAQALALPPFEFRWGGKRRTLPNFQSISAYLATQSENRDVNVTALMEEMEAHVEGIFSSPLAAIQKLIEDWAAHGNPVA